MAMPDDIKWTGASPSVIHFAESLIKEFHPILQEARIAFVFRSEAQKQGSRIILGQCSKVPAKMHPYLEYDYLIWLSEADYMAMDDLAREALIDHELCHCKLGINGWTIRPHDIQEFTDVIQRHGIWSPDIRAVKNAIDTYEMETLPGLIMGTLDRMGKVATLKGDELKQVEQEEPDNA
jgi:hypothetical protein